MWNKWKSISLWKKNLVALILGILFGLIFQEQVDFLQLIGNTFINLLKMMIVPLIFITLIHSIINLTCTEKIANLVFKSIILFFITALISILISILVATFTQLGAGVSISFNDYNTQVTSSTPSVLETILNIIPSNPFQSFAEGNVLQIVFLSIFTSIILSRLTINETNKVAILNMIDITKDLVFNMVYFIIQLMPLGIFALLAYSASVMGYDLIVKLSFFVITVCVLCIFQVFVVYSILLKLTGNSVLEFFKGAFQAMLVSFSLSSSSAALPVSMACAKTLNIDNTTRSFVIPLGSVLNMNGASIQQVVITIFIAQIVGMDLQLYHYFVIIITTLVATIGAAGVPSAGLIMTSVVLNALGLPVEGIAIVAGVDRIIDMVTSSVNVTGDLVIAKILANKKVDSLKQS